jgi:hypothetical protein
LQTICPGGLQTMILLFSASWVARITGVNHQCPAFFSFFFFFWDRFLWTSSPAVPSFAEQKF